MSIRLLKNKPSVSAVRAMTDELLFIRNHRDVLARILKIGERETFRTIDISQIDFHGLDIREVYTTSLPVDNAFEILSECSEYETESFNFGLLGADYANYLAGIRQQYAAAIAYGETQDWVVFVALGKHIVRYRAIGLLSALHTQFMDAATALIARDAGVVLKNPTPLLIVRSCYFEELQVYLGL
jgi:hypothetical protein